MWFGNDTIWRTILDVNHIVYFADKSGIMREQQQRTILHVGDLIVCGDHAGPLNPSYKRVGGILFSDHPILFDFFVVKLMGYKWYKFPVLVNAIKDRKLMEELYSEEVINEGSNGKNYFTSVINRFRMYSNEKNYDKVIDKISDEHTFHFIPAKGWTDHL